MNDKTTVMYNLSATYEDDGRTFKDFDTAKAEYDELIEYWPDAWTVVKEQTLYTCR